MNRNLDFAAEYQDVTALLENAQPAAFTLRTAPGVSPLADSGFYANVAQLSGHDSLAGYAGELDFSVGYDFGRVVEVESGIPFYFLSAKNISTEPGASHFPPVTVRWGCVYESRDQPPREARLPVYLDRNRAYRHSERKHRPSDLGLE